MDQQQRQSNKDSVPKGGNFSSSNNNKQKHSKGNFFHRKRQRVRSENDPTNSSQNGGGSGVSAKVRAADSLSSGARSQNTNQFDNGGLSLPTKTQDAVENVVKGIRSAELSDIPGFSYDPLTKKYYKILENSPGQPFGSTPKQLQRLKSEAQQKQHHKSLLSGSPSKGEGLEEGNKKKTEGELNWQRLNLPRFRFHREIGQFAHFKGGQIPSCETLKRVLDERLVRNAPKLATCVIDPEAQYEGRCFTELLSISRDGRVLIDSHSACFEHRPKKYGAIFVEARGAKQTEGGQQPIGLIVGGGRAEIGCRFSSGVSSLGLRFNRSNFFTNFTGTIVDSAIATMDSDVTCLIAATAETWLNPHGQLRTNCYVKMSPIQLDLTPEGEENLDCPLYNRQWRLNEQVWSVSFCPKTMQFCAGLERCARVFSVLDSHPSLWVPSNRRNVLSSAFSRPEGKCLYLGLRGNNMSQIDMRLVDSPATNPIVGYFKGSKNVCQIRALESRETELLTQRFNGELAIWDTRRRDVPLRVFEGHVNSQYKKLPWFVDHEERFVFATGADSVVRGWSLAPEGTAGGTKPLCEIPIPPVAAPLDVMQFPSVVYSDRWGGLYGNAGILIAFMDALYLHELREF